ncbi:MAG: ArsR/SmtB family transcription factor [Desulfopila sp.]
MTSAMTGSNRTRIEAKANILKALGHPTRLWMAERLSQGERCVRDLVAEIDADFSTISKHLAILKQAGVVTDEKRGKQVFYRLKVPCIIKVLPCIEEVIEANIQSHIELQK